MSRARVPRRCPDRHKKPVVRHPPTPDERCYLCGRIVRAEDKVVRVHETTVHRVCYEDDIRRGR
jgi:hypothetical protein